MRLLWREISFHISSKNEQEVEISFSREFQLMSKTGHAIKSESCHHMDFLQLDGF